MAELVDPSVVRELIDCDFNTGHMVWRERSEMLIPHKKGRLLWNARYAGKPALDALHARGYKYGNLFRRPCYAHRAVWAMFHDEWPLHIDHIDGDKLNNALSNLRSVTTSENAKNMKLSAANKSGRVGVFWAKHVQKWTAQIVVDGRAKYLGIFADKADAIAARAAAETKYGFHENHGRAA